MSSDEKALDFYPQHRERFALIIVGVGFKPPEKQMVVCFPSQLSLSFVLQQQEQQQQKWRRV